MNNLNSYSQLYVRIAIGISYLVFGLDRLGAWGAPGEKNVSWGDWQHFVTYAQQVMGFLPASLASVLAMIATAAEIILGPLLVLGLWTRVSAISSGVLALSFATSMAISFGIISPLSYSVFAVSAGSFLLAAVPHYKWSLDEVLKKGK